MQKALVFTVITAMLLIGYGSVNLVFANAPVQGLPLPTMTLAPSATHIPSPTYDNRQAQALATQAAANGESARAYATIAAAEATNAQAAYAQTTLVVAQITATKSANEQAAEYFAVIGGATATAVANQSNAEGVRHYTQMNQATLWGVYAAIVGALMLMAGGAYWIARVGDAIKLREKVLVVPEITPETLTAPTEPQEIGPIPGIPLWKIQALAGKTILRDLTSGQMTARTPLTEAEWTGAGNPFVKDGDFDDLRKWLAVRGYVSVRTDDNGKQFFRWNERGLAWLEQFASPSPTA